MAKYMIFLSCSIRLATELRPILDPVICQMTYVLKNETKSVKADITILGKKTPLPDF